MFCLGFLRSFELGEAPSSSIHLQILFTQTSRQVSVKNSAQKQLMNDRKQYLNEWYYY